MWDEMAGLVGRVWDTPDLPGHGDEPPTSWNEAVAGIGGLVAESGPGTTLVGYSMGGRLALAAALLGGGVRGLVLISAGLGIADPEERDRRRIEDGRLADRLERVGVEAFVDEWLSRDLFAGLGRRSTAWGRADRRMRLTNSAVGLAGALRSLGQGSQPYLGDRIGELAMPLTTVAGGCDSRYARLAQHLARQARVGTVRVIDGVGHAAVAEAPGTVAEVIRTALAG